MTAKNLGAAMAVCAVLAGCGPKNEGAAKAASDEVAVSVNGEELKQSKVDEEVELMMKAQGDKIPAEQREYARKMMGNQLVQSFIVEKVLVTKAKAEGFTVTDADRKEREAELLKAVARMPDAPKSLDEYYKKFPLGEARARAEFENGILIDKMLKSYGEKANAGKDYTAEAKKQIESIVAKNAAASTSEADALKKIKALKAELDGVKGEKELAAKFAELAKANSACPSSAKGGDLGEFTHGQMVKEFDEVAFSQPVGKVSDPVKTQFGYHLVMTTKKTPAVEAKGNEPAVPERVQASHILVKTEKAQKVPTEEEVIKFLKSRDSRSFTQEFVIGEVKKAKIKASEAYKQFLPQPDEPAAKPAPEAKPAAKPEAKSAPAAKPEAKPAAKPATKVESKPVARPAAKAEAKPAAKPAAPVEKKAAK